MGIGLGHFPNANLVIENVPDAEVDAAVAEKMEGKIEALVVRTFIDPETIGMGYAMTLRPDFDPEVVYAILMATAARIVATADEMLPDRQSSKVLIEAFETSAKLHFEESST